MAIYVPVIREVTGDGLLAIQPTNMAASPRIIY